MLLLLLGMLIFLLPSLRNLSNIMGLSFSTPSHSALHIHIGCIYMLWMGIWVVRLDNCWVFGHTSKILEQYNSLWIIFDRIFSFNPCTIQQLVARQLRREKIKPRHCGNGVVMGLSSCIYCIWSISITLYMFDIDVWSSLTGSDLQPQPFSFQMVLLGLLH